MRPLTLAAAGLGTGALFPLAGLGLGASGPALALLAAVPPVLALAAWLLGQQASAHAGEELRRAARARRDEAERVAAEILQRSRTLLAAAEALGASAGETAAGVRETSDTVARLAGSTTASALTAETVVGLALESERAAARGLSIAERSRDALTLVAAEVHALAGLVAGLEARMRGVLDGADALARAAARAQALTSMARLQADGGLLPPEALPALTARLDGHVEETVAAAQRARALLGEMHEDIASAARAAEAGSLRAGEGAMVLEGAAGALRELAGALATSAASGREIAAVAQLQDAGVESLRAAVNGIFLAGERSSASSGEVAGEARALADLAARLRRASRPDQ